MTWKPRAYNPTVTASEIPVKRNALTVPNASCVHWTPLQRRIEETVIQRTVLRK
jgi:hypothetical protein